MYQKYRVTGIMANKMKNEEKTAGSVPISKIRVQRIRRKLFTARIRCYWRVQMLRTRLIKLAASWRAKMSPQIAKNMPGGVTHR